MKKSDEPELVIILPAFNESESLKILIKMLHDTLDNKLNFVIVVVNNMSTDETASVSKKMGAIVIHQHIRGYGSSVQAGFNFVKQKLRTKYTLVMDADGTYDSKDILTAYEILSKNEADFVSGNRFAHMDEDAMSFTNKVGNNILSSISRKLLKIDIHDFSTGLKGFKSIFLDLFLQRSIDFPFATEMLVIANLYNLRIKEFPARYHKRIGKTKLVPFRDGTRLLVTVIRLMRDSRPLPFFGTIGLVFAIFGIIFGTTIVIEWLETGYITRIPTTILSVLLIIIGFQFFSLGLISDMMRENRNRSTLFFTED